MALAVKTMPDNRTGTGFGGLALTSLLGAVYVVGAIAVVAFGVPRLWATGVSPWLEPLLGSFVDVAGLIVVVLFAAGLLISLGLTLLGGRAQPGTRAGIFTVLVGLLLIGWLAVLVGRILERTVFTSPDAHWVGLGVALALGVALLIWCGILMQRPRFRTSMEAFEAQGWFAATAYKGSQGVKVRRATLLGILILVGTGVYTLLNHRTLDAGARDWLLVVPFTGGQTLKLLPDVKYTLPILLSVVGLWLAYRVVNIPVFADFMIATEAEINKVSWASRKSLVQDTIVVLVTVFLFTVFLFAVDVAWGWLLSNKYVHVLQIDTNRPVETKNVEEQDW